MATLSALWVPLCVPYECHSERLFFIDLFHRPLSFDHFHQALHAFRRNSSRKPSVGWRSPLASRPSRPRSPAAGRSSMSSTRCASSSCISTARAADAAPSGRAAWGSASSRLTTRWRASASLSAEASIKQCLLSHMIRVRVSAWRGLSHSRVTGRVDARGRDSALGTLLNLSGGRARASRALWQHTSSFGIAVGTLSRSRDGQQGSNREHATG